LGVTGADGILHLMGLHYFPFLVIINVLRCEGRNDEKYTENCYKLHYYD
jgi:hypothetical protein